MWTGIVGALIVAFFTAFAFAELAKRYPEAGSGGAYYFAEKALLDRENPAHRRWSRLAKFITGWAAHLFYWVYPTAMVAFMATLVVYILRPVGFESSTALGAEAKDPKRDIPRGVILSLIIQGIFAYLFEYFAANYAMSSALTAKAADGTVVNGFAAAGVSSAPIGDLAIQVGNALLGGNGFALMVILAITVAIAILGTTLAAMNTAVRI